MQQDVTIPYSNRSESIKDSWFIYFSTHDSTTNAKSLTPLFSIIIAKFGQDRDRCNKIEGVIPFHTPTVVKVLRIVGS